MKSICFVTPYFGVLPSNFQLWLNSCESNPTVNWLIFTDDKTSFDYPNNVLVYHISFEQLIRRISSFYDFEISINQPFKICDFRPAYGDIFRAELEGYDFWGYCDVDLIFGNIRSLITDDILTAYDKILTRGHLTLFQNSEMLKKIYKREINGTESYKQVFQSSEHYSFDEWGGANNNINHICLACDVPVYNEIIFSDIYVGKFAFYPYQLMKQEAHISPSVYIWQSGDGRLYRYYVNNLSGTLCREEILYLHLQKRNMRIHPNCLRADCILIKPNEYTAHNGEITVDFVREAGKDKLIYPDFVKLRIKNLKRKIRKLLARG